MRRIKSNPYARLLFHFILMFKDDNINSLSPADEHDLNMEGLTFPLVIVKTKGLKEMSSIFVYQ